MGGGEFWTGGGSLTSATGPLTRGAADYMSSMAGRSLTSATGPLKRGAADYMSSMAGRSFRTKKPLSDSVGKKVNDVHIHFDVNVLVNEDGRTKISPSMKVSK